MFNRLIERFESNKYANYDVLIRSDDLATVFIAVLALTSNEGNARHASSMISFTGLEKIDHLLNKTKNRVLEASNLLLEYGLSLNDATVQCLPIATQFVAILPHLIDSARLICIDPSLEEYLEDEILSELVV